MACVGAIIITPCAHKSAETMKKKCLNYTAKNHEFLKVVENRIEQCLLPTFFNVVNNIDQVVEPESNPQSGVTMLNNIVDNIEQCGQHNIAQSCFQQLSRTRDLNS